MQIRIHTARNQLKAIQRKTGWRTQAEIVRMVQQLSVISPVTGTQAFEWPAAVVLIRVITARRIKSD